MLTDINQYVLQIAIITIKLEKIELKNQEAGDNIMFKY